MQFRGMEDRLNPVAPADADESTVGGYWAIHGRAPGFEGSDGMPYTVAIEAERVEGEVDVWAAYFVFLRWAADSTAIMGHLETGDVVRGPSDAEAREAIGRLPLNEVKQLLDDSISRYESMNEL